MYTTHSIKTISEDCAGAILLIPASLKASVFASQEQYSQNVQPT